MECEAKAKRLQQVEGELKRVEHTLAFERRSRAVEVKGQVRRELIPFQEEIMELKSKLRETQRDVCDRANFKLRCERAAADLVLAAEREADLHIEVAQLREELAGLQRKEAGKMRALAREARQQGRDLASTEADKRVEAAQRRAQEAEQRAEDAERRALLAGEACAQAREDAISEAEAASAAIEAKEVADYELLLATRREERVRAKAGKLQSQAEKFKGAPADRTADEWAALSREAEWQAAHRERNYLIGFFKSHKWRVSDIAWVLDKLCLTSELFQTKPFFTTYYERVGELMEKLKHEHFGPSFALYLHYELRLTLPKILQITQAASKKYDRATDRYKNKELLFDPFHKDDRTGGYLYIPVPRISPPDGRIIPIIRSLESKIGVVPGEDGQLALRSFTAVVQELLAKDPGTHDMPPLPEYMGGHIEVPIVISFDATGFGSQQLNTIAARNPYLPQSAQLLRIFGVGNCADSKDGTSRLLGGNQQIINDLIVAKECTEFEVRGEKVKVKPKIYVVTDVSALRHTEHLSNSGWCGCSRDFALRQTPAKPRTISEMYELLKKCYSPTREDRFILSHNPLPGESLPRPCTAPRCFFAHNRSTAADELKALRIKEAELRAVDTKQGREAWSKWRMEHARVHLNVQPGMYGKPMLEHDMVDQIMDPLHYAELGDPKTPWKHGILNNASDLAREKISQQLKEWRHPLDCKRKEDGRCREQKWFSGEKWVSFCAGHSGSPGGPRAIAKLVHIIAEDMQTRGVDLGSGVAEPAAAAIIKAPKNKGSSSFSARNATALSASADSQAVQQTACQHTHTQQLVQHIPSSMEVAADDDDIAVIKKMYGSRAQTLINTLLAWDAYFDWYYALKFSHISLFADQAAKEARAFDNMIKAIDMHETFERLSIRKHGSFLPHGAIYKTTRDILNVGDVWSFSLSALELQNAETKRVARDSGSRRLKMTSSAQARVSLRGKEGPANLITKKGYSTSMSLSVIKHLLVAQCLRAGDGLVSTPESRRKQRIFGKDAAGRTKLMSVGVKLEKLGDDYVAKEDTCMKAFVRLLGAIALEQTQLAIDE